MSASDAVGSESIIPKSIMSSSIKQSVLIAYVVGAVVIFLALTSYLMNRHITDLLMWMQQVFGWGYALVYGSLLGVALFAWQRLSVCMDAGVNTENRQPAYWYELGQQAAGGIATLSLTFTLLGISLGIGALSDKTIDPESVQVIIQELTGHFSTAFMTTVVGLPTAAVLRAMMSLRYVRLTP